MYLYTLSVKQEQEADVEYKHVWNTYRSKGSVWRTERFKTEINKINILI